MPLVRKSGRKNSALETSITVNWTGMFRLAKKLNYYANTRHFKLTVRASRGKMPTEKNDLVISAYTRQDYNNL